MTDDAAVDYIAFLDELRASGTTNMFGAGPYLRQEFGLSRDYANEILCAWMKLDRTRPAAERAPEMVKMLFQGRQFR